MFVYSCAIIRAMHSAQRSASGSFFLHVFAAMGQLLQISTCKACLLLSRFSEGNAAGIFVYQMQWHSRIYL